MTTTTTPVPTSTGSFPVVEDPLAHVGSLVRSARQHRGLTQAQLAERLAHQPVGHPPHRAGRAERQPRDAHAHRRGARLPHRHARRTAADPPAGARRPDPERPDRRQHQQERRGRPAVRLAAQPRHHAPAQRRPDRRGGPHRRGAALRRGPRHVVDRRSRPRDRRPRAPPARLDRRRRRPPHPVDHHVPRAAAGPRGRVPAPVRGRLRPGHPHRRAAPDRPAPVRAGRHGDRRRLPRARHAAAARRTSRSSSPSAATR